MRQLISGAVAIAWSAVALTAAPAKQTATPTIELNVPVSAISSFQGTNGATIWPNLGDTVTFTVTFSKSLSNKDVGIRVACYQGTTLVYGEIAHYYDPFLLGGSSSYWLNASPGPANCVAELFYWSYQGGQKYNVLATTQFTAGGA